jgi:hypothetical protein
VALAENAVKATATASVLPVWDPTLNSYVFAAFILNTDEAYDRGFTYDAENDKLHVEFKIQASSYVYRQLLAKYGYADHGVSVIVRTTWTNGDATYAQDYIYTDELVQKCCGNYDFTFDVNVGARENFTATIMVITDAGVEIASETFAVDKG